MDDGPPPPPLFLAHTQENEEKRREETVGWLAGWGGKRVLRRGPPAKYVFSFPSFSFSSSSFRRKCVVVVLVTPAGQPRSKLVVLFFVGGGGGGGSPQLESGGHGVHTRLEKNYVRALSHTYILQRARK